MKVAIVLSLALAVASAAKVPTQKVHQYQLEDSRIVGGEESDAHEFPFIVSLLITRTTPGQIICGGSIIDSRNILTAAHCTDVMQSAQVIAGTNNRVLPGSDGGVTVTANSVTVHPNWISALIDNDLAVIHLDEDQALELSDTIAAITPSRNEPTEGMLTHAAGWGKTSDNAAGATSILEDVGNLPIITREACKDVYLSVDESTICVATNDGTGVCSGDSGGPLWVEGNAGEQVGISSFVASAGCETDLPHGFTNVAMFADWIDSVMVG